MIFLIFQMADVKHGESLLYWLLSPAIVLQKTMSLFERF